MSREGSHRASPIVNRLTDACEFPGEALVMIASPLLPHKGLPVRRVYCPCTGTEQWKRLRGRALRQE